jgi:hypothetical protein
MNASFAFEAIIGPALGDYNRHAAFVTGFYKSSLHLRVMWSCFLNDQFIFADQSKVVGIVSTVADPGSNPMLATILAGFFACRQLGVFSNVTHSLIGYSFFDLLHLLYFTVIECFRFTTLQYSPLFIGAVFTLVVSTVVWILRTFFNWLAARWARFNRFYTYLKKVLGPYFRKAITYFLKIDRYLKLFSG